MEFIAVELSKGGWRVIRFKFSYMNQQRIHNRKKMPDKMQKLQECCTQQVKNQKTAEKIIIGGKSLGGRVASLIADDLAANLKVIGCFFLGYPFHPIGKKEQKRIKHLKSMITPTLILQGERDAMGNKDEVDQYQLSPSVRLKWLIDGDHSFKHRKKAIVNELDNLNQL